MTSEERKAWFQGHWVGWLRPVSIVALVAALAAIYFLEWLPEPSFAWIVALLFALAAGVAPAAQGAKLATTPWARWTSAAIGLVVVVAILWPVWKMTAPGTPIAEQTIGAKQTLDIPETPSSSLTVLVEDAGLLRGAGFDRRIDYRIAATDDSGHEQFLEGELLRVHTAGRGRKGAPTSSERVRLAELHSLSWQGGAPLHLKLVAGGADVLVQVFESAVPWLLLFVLVGAALAAGVVVDARALPRQERTFVPHAAAIGLLFLLMTQDALEPLAPVKPLFGSVLMSGAGGVLVGIALSWAGRRYLGRHAAVAVVASGGSGGAKAGRGKRGKGRK